MSQPLSTLGKQRLNALFAATAAAFGVSASDPRLGQHFNPTSEQAVQFFQNLKRNVLADSLYAATVPLQQSLQPKAIQLANPFFSSLPMIPVSDTTGQKVILGLTGRVASRTNTSSGERVPKRLNQQDNQDWAVKQTNFDVALSYADIDAWAKFQNFEALYMQIVREAIVNDMLVTGWYGTSAAAGTNIGTNPNLQDLNIGWLEKIRTFNSTSQHVGSGVSIGATGTYKNLSEAIHDIKQVVSAAFRNRGDLVALVGDNLLVNAMDKFYETHGNTPSEKVLINGVVTNDFGGLPTFSPPFFPNSTIVITPLSNLAVYYQDSSIRRTQQDWPAKDEVREFNSMNLAYVVQEEFATAMVEGITLV
ncbi:P2 family phage major capsid protein [Methylomonas sp. EFPC1]|uniref:P2 family phage major capsid protein n=1 Tax=Methylomonas sp. EFPC1 TaxID=2812647 RepID=UPI001968370D|nr:P2 family phage major capsid protein [Methylomonas sp. EFPC1]QSB01981.1 P2 family phage major capsid protein [Methylomonas sp. EFPC1]